MNKVLCIILGGGRGSRLFPLTKERCKPAVPLLGKYRLIDIPISNCLNSGFNRIYILTQFLSESLNKHVNKTYKMDSFGKGFIEIMAAEQSMEDTSWFQGTADAVRRCFKHFNDPLIKYIFVLSGDQLYKMDFQKMFNYHKRKKAEITIACNYVSEKDIQKLGIIGINKEKKIKKFIEKPQDIGQVEDVAIQQHNNSNKVFLGSMGIYLFNKATLVELLSDNKKIDFGKEIIPQAINLKSTYAFCFDGYWQDIGTIKNFYEENLSMNNLVPPFNMFDEKWPIFTRTRYLSPAKVQKSLIEKSIISEGSIISSSKIVNSIIGLRFRIGKDSDIINSIAMGCDYYETSDEIKKQSNNIPSLGVGKNCFIKNAILDKNVRIGDNVKIINEKNIDYYDGLDYYIRDGIVIISKNAVIKSGTII